ncbi:MAG: AbrB/MazE/SpoVT family DNA-binding domain-containing protein [bacterium]|nr:AbrB/MazE/SpoVT family DNA-binding domain-containing protein [bacterium]
MEIAKVSSKGQITIPAEIRKKLNLKEGDKVLFIEENGKIVLLNAGYVAIKEAQKLMEQEGEKANLKTEEDVLELTKDVRRELWSKKYENNA